MHSPPCPPPPPSTPPFPYVAFSALVLISVAISFLIIDLIEHNEDNNGRTLDREQGYSGLSLQDAEALPWFAYEANAMACCVICLDYFRKGERCRSFPVCKHNFHARCIDSWLVRRLTCPTCRSPFIFQRRLDIV
ncbi:hypothetical protein MANES_05G160900v8 [Manihot esculenta]|uniref:RING-type domain-containing protein n=1 Tax=Manihot esculenta TaxID=3983 RepID=A0A2C9VZ81_MANES|nr:hypothetical protein MANES_05G160900v8 [Manihot esculenta]